MVITITANTATAAMGMMRMVTTTLEIMGTPTAMLPASSIRTRRAGRSTLSLLR
ncbi:MAG: hypothetical protein KF705_04300 [Phycisphaeraceae bacterium]|nr:hypothetical protein [Phycisphaeraceae bacterium]